MLMTSALASVMAVIAFEPINFSMISLVMAFAVVSGNRDACMLNMVRPISFCSSACVEAIFKPIALKVLFYLS